MCLRSASLCWSWKWLSHSLLLFSSDLFNTQTFHFFNAGFTSYWLNQRNLAALHLCECAELQPIDQYHHFMIIMYTICRTLVIPGSTRLHFCFFFVHHQSLFSLCTCVSPVCQSLCLCLFSLPLSSIHSLCQLLANPSSNPVKECYAVSSYLGWSIHTHTHTHSYAHRYSSSPSPLFSILPLCKCVFCSSSATRSFIHEPEMEKRWANLFTANFTVCSVCVPVCECAHTEITSVQIIWMQFCPFLP